MGKNQDEMTDQAVVKIPPYYYIHVLDQTTNVTRLEIGPQTFVRKDNEKVVLSPQKMIIVPPAHYCTIRNPVSRNEKGDIVVDNLGQIQLLHADLEVRLTQNPFPLYPGEDVQLTTRPLTVVPSMTALRLKVTRDFKDVDVQRVAGDEFLFEGPGTYIPRKEVEVMHTVKSDVIRSNEALKLKALRQTVDRDGITRVAGEEWLVRRQGAYLPGAYEEIVERCQATILTDLTAIHVQATRSFKDQMGVERKNGEEYLITSEDMESFIPEVYEKIVGIVEITTLNSRQYCVILNPINEVDGKPRLGHKKLVEGEASFFLKPGEELQKGIEDMYVLSDDEGIVLRATESYLDESVTPAVKRQPGDRWMLKGPMEYIPPVEVEVITTRKAIPLHENEGIYVRNTRTGKVRGVVGQTYMLGEDEELWSKYIPPLIKTLLNPNRDVCADRGEYINPIKEKRAAKDDKPVHRSNVVQDVWDSSRVVTFLVPHNAAVQIYDYLSKKSRVVFGPDLVMLEPNEDFTQMSLSGGKPKKPNMIRTIAVLLGPDYCSDVITVETSDHARLQLGLSYNWHFQIDVNDPNQGAKIFCVPDFIGDMCNAIASQIRGAVSAVSFDDFHKNSSRIIRIAVFGLDESIKPRDKLHFSVNNLVVTSIDVRSVEPVDQRTRDSLQKSVTLAIEITTQSQEAAAKREAERIDQEARGRLERQRILDDAEAEKARRELLILLAESAAVESTGQAKAEATSRAEAARIEAEAAVQAARLKAEANRIEAEAELERLKAARDAEIQFLSEQNRLEIERSEQMCRIESAKFKTMVETLGSETIRAIASEPHNHQVRLLQALGIQSTLITDGKSPINLFGTASGLIAANPAASSSII